jgi:hypothetical protein
MTKSLHVLGDAPFASAEARRAERSPHPDSMDFIFREPPAQFASHGVREALREPASRRWLKNQIDPPVAAIRTHHALPQRGKRHAATSRPNKRLKVWLA